jgi:hypothetical protein
MLTCMNDNVNTGILLRNVNICRKKCIFADNMRSLDLLQNKMQSLTFKLEYPRNFEAIYIFNVFKVGITRF